MRGTDRCAPGRSHPSVSPRPRPSTFSWGSLCAPRCSLLSLAVFLCVLSHHRAHAHGYLAVPRSRNVVFNSNYCPHCLNAGGSGATATGLHGICGDPFVGTRDHEEGGKFFSDAPQATYKQGQDIELKVVISANHHGRFQYRVCRYSGSEKAALTEACLDKHVLRMSEGEQAPGEVYWYTGPNDSPQTYTMRYKLPSGLTCDGIETKCVLQWYWASQNSCILQSPDPPPQYLPSSNMSKCGPGNVGGEAFWNCASIRITKDGSGGDVPTSVPTPNPGSDSAPNPTLSPTPQVPEVPEAKPPKKKPPKKKPAKKPGKPTKPGRKPKKPTKPGRPSAIPKAPSTTSGSASRAEEFCRHHEPGFYPDPASTGFFRCTSAGAFAFDCPDGLVFNSELSLCDWGVA